MVETTKRRSGWPIRRTLSALGVSATSYYRWRREHEQGRGGVDPPRPVQAYEALPAEKAAVKAYALKHTELRHRELAWRMVDEDVAHLSASTVYRILKESNLVSPWRRRSKRRRDESERAQSPNERWATDLMYLRVGCGQYYFVAFMDEYSRYLVHWELLSDMGSSSVSLAAQTALETLARNADGSLERTPQIRSDNGSCYIAREFRQVLAEHKLTHQRIKPRCPEENGLMERANRTFREALEEVKLTDRLQAEREIGRIVRWYNETRLHSALGYLRPIDYYRGEPEKLHESRRVKLATARHRRREHNLTLRQRTLPLHPEPTTP